MVEIQEIQEIKKEEIHLADVVEVTADQKEVKKDLHLQTDLLPQCQPSLVNKTTNNHKIKFK